MPSDIELLAAAVARLTEKIGKKTHDPRGARSCHFRASPAEKAALDAAAAAKGMNRSDFVREAINAVIPNVMQINRHIPASVLAYNNRRKVGHFDDPKTDARARGNSVARDVATRQAVALHHQSRAILESLNNAPETARAERAERSAMLGENAIGMLTEPKKGL